MHPFHIISVGPGNPKWITVEGVEWIEQMDVLAVPAPRGDDQSTAERIARRYIKENTEIVFLELPMTLDITLLETSWKTAAEQVYGKMKEGLKVGMLVLGDATLFGSSSYVSMALALIDKTITTLICPGVISPTACSARLGQPLALGNENLTILPDTEINDDLENAIRLGGTIVMMKISRSLQNVINFLESRNLLEHASVVIKGGRDDEEVIVEDILTLRGQNVPYMSLLILKVPSISVESKPAEIKDLDNVDALITPGRGKLFVVGFGPGHREHLTYRARQAILASDCIVGYVTYLRLVKELLEGKEIIRGGMTEEVDRAIAAVEAARQGKIVSLISSGDAGVFGMAGPVYEVLMNQGWKPGDDPEIEIVPGISSINACSTLLGAPLGHDYCAISLSDLLTPWDVIEKRLVSAARGDFICGLYNPKSGRRTEQIVQARDIFLQHRSPSTPVGLVKSGYRKRQNIDVTDLEHMLNFDIGMLTTVIIGNSTTVEYEGLLVTPRGYKRKYDLSNAEVHEGIESAPVGGNWSLKQDPS